MSPRFWKKDQHKHVWRKESLVFVSVERCRYCSAVSSVERARLMEIERELWQSETCKLEHEHDRKCEDRTFWAVCRVIKNELQAVILQEREKRVKSRYN